MAYTTINKSTEHFNTKIYTGTGSSLALTGVGFQPDFTWIKARSNAENHNLFDAVRGATKRIRSNGAEVEDTRTTSLTAFGSDGFTLGSGSQVNTSGWTFASWNWKANGAGSADTSGTINSTVSANTTAGFSVVKYVGDGTGGNNTIAHGLGVAPDCVMYKNLDTARNWIVYHQGIGPTKNLYLDLTNGANTASNTFNNVAPTSTFLNVNDSVGVNESGDNHVAYCFANKPGFSKMGWYRGNVSTDGTVAYTGFKPALVIIKNADASEHWRMYDDKRDVSNQMFRNLLPNHSSAENTTDNGSEEIDFLSTGFKLRSSAAQLNGAGTEYIYLAFASNPLVANVGESIPTTAR